MLKSCFSGVYNFRRIVQNENISMKGTATFISIDDEKYRYHEVGHYVQHETPKSFFQTRFFIIENTSFVIQKIDGSALHEFQIPQDSSFPLVLRHAHYCKNDVYDITLTFLSEHEFKTSYKIKGPQKNEEIHTHYMQENK